MQDPTKLAQANLLFKIIGSTTPTPPLLPTTGPRRSCSMTESVLLPKFALIHKEEGMVTGDTVGVVNV